MGKRTLRSSSFLVLAVLGACGELGQNPEGGEGGASAGGIRAVGGTISRAGATGSGGTLSLGGSGGATSVAGFGAVGAGGGDIPSSGGVNVGGATDSAGMDSAGASTTGGAATGGAGATGGASTTGGADGIGGAGGAGGFAVALSNSSWDVVATLTEPGGGPFPGCSRIAFTLRARTWGGADQITITVGRDGEGFQFDLAPRGTIYRLWSELAALPALSVCPNQYIALQEVELIAVDLDQDGVADRLLGTGTGQHWTGTEPGPAISVQITGAPDVTRPILVFPEPVHPLDRWVFGASEPLQEEEDIRLLGDPEIDPWPDSGSVSAWLTFNDDGQVLPFSGTWTVGGHASDFAGLPLEPRGSLRTIEDPGIFPEDGFEGAVLKAVLTGATRKVSQIGNLAALGGQASLLVPADSTVTLHLAHRSGTSGVRLVARGLQTGAWSGVDRLSIEAGAIGTREVAGNLEWHTGQLPTNDATWPYASGMQTIWIPLREAGDVVLRVSGGSSCTAPCVEHGVLIDDVRME